MERIVKMNIQNIPEGKIGYEVVTLDGGVLYHYGIYPDLESAKFAAAGYEGRFVVKVVD